MKKTISGSAAALFDHIKEKFSIKNDAQLSRALAVSPGCISKLRSGGLPVGPSVILAVHEQFDMPVADIRALVAP